MIRCYENMLCIDDVNKCKMVMISYPHHQWFPDSKLDLPRWSGFEDLDGLGKRVSVQMNVIDKHQLVSREETAMMICHTPRQQRANDDHGASNI